jgi:hypothetical protein
MKRFSLGVVVSMVLIGCGGKGDFTLNLNAYDPHNGGTVRLKLKEAGTMVGSAVSATVTAGSASLVVADVLESGKSYNADWFIDNNSDGTCDPCGVGSGEHAWRLPVTSTGADQALSHTHNTTFTNIAPF